MRGILLATGQCAGLEGLSRFPAMTEVAGKSILQHQVDSLREQGVNDITVVRHHRRCVAEGNVHYAHDPVGLSRSASALFAAQGDLVGDVICSYGNMIYHPAVLSALLEAPMACTLVVDRGWRKSRDPRDRSDREQDLVRVTTHGLVLEITQNWSASGLFGEFIGLWRMSAGFVTRLWGIYQSLLALCSPEIGRQLLVSDVINAAIAQGEMVAVLTVDGAWRGISTLQDAQNAGEAFTRWMR